MEGLRSYTALREMLQTDPSVNYSYKVSLLVSSRSQVSATGKPEPGEETKQCELV